MQLRCEAYLSTPSADASAPCASLARVAAILDGFFFLFFVKQLNKRVFLVVTAALLLDLRLVLALRVVTWPNLRACRWSFIGGRDFCDFAKKKLVPRLRAEPPFVLV